jgi:hypothetical protein
MTDQVYQSNLEAAIAFKQMTGITIRLTPYDLLARIVRKSDDQIVVAIKVHEVHEYRTSVVLKNQGTRLIQFRRVDGVGWRQIGLPVTMWESDFTPVHHSIFGPGKTVAEWLQARQFEADCGRPGTDNHPLDSFQRTVVDGPDFTTRKMARHWA